MSLGGRSAVPAHRRATPLIPVCGRFLPNGQALRAGAECKRRALQPVCASLFGHALGTATRPFGPPMLAQRL